MDEIAVFKLLNGEEIIATIDVVDEVSISLKNVAIIAMIPEQSGRIGFRMVPFMPYCTNKIFVFNASLVMTKGDPHPDLLNDYNKNFGSGIVIAPKSILK